MFSVCSVNLSDCSIFSVVLNEERASAEQAAALFSECSAFFVRPLLTLPALQSLKFLNFSEKRWWRHQGSFQRAADRCVLPLFQWAVGQDLEMEEQLVLELFEAVRYVRQKLSWERKACVCVFVFFHVMHPHPRWSVSVCCSRDGESMSLLSSSSKQGLRETILRLTLTENRVKATWAVFIIQRPMSGYCCHGNKTTYVQT